MDAVTATAAPSATRWRVVAALAVVYVVWGSTYFAIGEAVRTIPPFLMASARFAVAGGILFWWRRHRGVPRPTHRQWRSAAFVGGLLLAGGNGCLSWSEQRMPSGLAALIFAITPAAVVALEWLRPRGRRPALSVVAGLAVGLAGMVLLVGPARLEAARNADLLTTIVCVLAPCFWAVGSLCGRDAAQSPDLFLASAMQMLAGSVGLVVLAVATGEFAAFAPAAVTLRSAAAWAYLVVFGSLAGFTAYSYLIRTTTAAVATTNTYVNPVVAVGLGWALGGEVVTGRVLLAAALLLGGVALITLWRGRS